MESYKTFFSYARADSEFALKLAKDLLNKGHNIWLDQLNISPGQRWDSKIENALSECEILLVILSPQSVNSNNVLDEISYFLEEGKQIIPIMLLDCKVPFRIRRVQYIDFTKDYHYGLNNLDTLLVANQQNIYIPPKTTDSKNLHASSNSMYFEHEKIPNEPPHTSSSENNVNDKGSENNSPVESLESSQVFYPDYDDTVVHYKKKSRLSFFSNKYVMVIGSATTLAIVIFFFSIGKSSEDSKDFKDSVDSSEFKIWGKPTPNSQLTYTTLYHTDSISEFEAVQTSNFMKRYENSSTSFGYLIIDSIRYQLDRFRDTIIFKYNMYRENEVTQAIKYSMSNFGKLLSDSLFNNRPLQVVAHNIYNNQTYYRLNFYN